MIRVVVVSSIRVAFLGATLATVAAIVLASAAPRGASRAHAGRAPLRVAASPSLRILGETVTALQGGGTRLLDLETGRAEALALPSGMGLDQASLSPWEEDGRRQVVGLGWDRSGSGPWSYRGAIGLVRMSLPGGVVLDRVSLDRGLLPGSPPCWIPGTAASVLYAGTDCGLYRIDFPAEPGTGPRPRRIQWRAPMPGGDVLVRDVAWPDDPRLGGRLLATLCPKDPATGRYGEAQIWWLELDGDDDTIVAAGRLLEPSPAGDAGEPRFPNVVSTTDGSLLLAYLAQSPGMPGYQLRAAALRCCADAKVPHARAAESYVLAEGCPGVMPAGSADGRSVTVAQSSVSAARVAVAGDLSLVAAKSPRSGGRSGPRAARPPRG